MSSDSKGAETWYKGHILMAGGVKIPFDYPGDELDSTVKNVYEKGEWEAKPGELIYFEQLHVLADKVVAVEIDIYEI